MNFKVKSAIEQSITVLREAIGYPKKNEESFSNSSYLQYVKDKSYEQLVQALVKLHKAWDDCE